MDHETTPDVVGPSPEAPRLTMGLMLRGVAERFFELDKGWPRTARELTLGPGAMIGRYVQGDRRVYANPFAYLVVGTAVSILVQKAVHFQEKMIASSHTAMMEFPLQLEFAERFTELLSQNALYVSIGIVVPLALLLRLFFLRSGYNLAECFVFALYSVGHLALLGLVLIPLYMLLPSAALKGVAGICVAVIYTSFAARGFFSGRLIAVVFKTAIAYVAAYCVFFLVMMVLILAYIFAILVPTSSGREWDLVTATDYGVVPVIEKLLDEGADINQTLQRTALHVAAENGDLTIVELLIERGADVNLQDIHGRTPLFVAIAEHRPEVAMRLAKENVDLGVLANDGSTLLMAAVRADNLELVRWAIERGTDVDAVRPKKTHATALMMAAGRGHLEIVQLLLSAGADPNVTNHEGETALDLAKGREVRELLRAAPSEPAEAPVDTEARTGS
jgi:hypothetical protein